MNKLYFGDNLDMLREKIKDESVDLVYLDPPFKSNANYNVLFKPGGVVSEAQAEAFRDTWEWGDSARDAYDDVMKLNGDVALVLSGLRAMTAPAMYLEGTWLAFLGYASTPYILSALALAELVTDQLPMTPSRKVPMQFGARIVSGGLCGTALGASGGTGSPASGLAS